MTRTLARSVVTAPVVAMVLLGTGWLGARSPATPATDEGDVPVVVRPHEIVWEDRGEGVRGAVLVGDPAEPGPFVLRLAYPAGYRKGPHTHPRDAYVTVLDGSYFRGYGNTFDQSQAIELTPGTFSVNPGNVSHYEWTTQPAMLEIHAVGPWATAYVDSQGHPRANGSPCTERHKGSSLTSRSE